MKALRVEKMKAAVREIDKPEAAGEALVRVMLSGICNTDLNCSGYAGFKGTIGHGLWASLKKLLTRSWWGRELSVRSTPVVENVSYVRQAILATVRAGRCSAFMDAMAHMLNSCDCQPSIFILFRHAA